MTVSAGGGAGRHLAGALALAAASVAATAAHAQSSWGQAGVSAALERGGAEVVQRFAPPPGAQLPAGALAARVYADSAYEGSARVETRLCWRSVADCVSLAGGRASTAAFRGRPAHGPFLLVHRAAGSGPLASPVFMRSNLVVWYEGPARPQ